MLKDIFILVEVNIINSNKFFDYTQKELLIKFIKFLQENLKIGGEITVKFVSDRIGRMTTGVRKKHGQIIVYVKDRLLIDILRTLSHEWVHEYQDQTKYLKKHKHRDIGGPIENMANSLSGIIMKKFQKKYPEYEKLLYGEK